jgi:hypothetical protein
MTNGLQYINYNEDKGNIILSHLYVGTCTGTVLKTFSHQLRGLDWTIGFIGAAVTTTLNYKYLRQLINGVFLKLAFFPPGYERLLLHFSPATDSLTPFGLICPPFTTSSQPKTEHSSQQ